MAIEIKDKSGFLGALSPTLAVNPANFDGIFSTPQSVTGVLNSGLSNSTSLFSGLFTDAPNRIGSIASGVAAVTGDLRGVGVASTDAASILFNGNVEGTGTTFVDRVRVRVDQPGPNPANVGAGDFLIEVWVRPSSTENQNVNNVTASGTGWTNGCAIWDMDVFGSAVGGMGGGIGQGRAYFGAGNTSGSANNDTVLGTTDLRDDNWHYLVFQRQGGELSVYVDGTREAFTTNGPTGDLSIPVNVAGRPDSNPYLVLAAEKHDVIPASEVAFYGHMYDFRVSNIARYSGTSMTVPTAPLDTDANTVLHWRLNDSSSPAVDLAASNSPGFNNQGEWRISSQGYPQQSLLAPPVSTAHGYFESLLLEPGFEVAYTGRSNAEVYPLAWAQPSNYNPAQLNYDPVEDAMQSLWLPGSNSSKEWGPGTAAGTSPFSPPFAPTDDSVAFYWETKYPVYWATKDGGGRVEDVETHKEFMVHHDESGGLNDNKLFEIRTRYAQVSQGEVGRIDVRDYANGITTTTVEGPANSYVPQNEFIILPEVWTYYWLIIDFANSETTLWVSDETRPVVRILDELPLIIDPAVRIDGFGFRQNTSQDRNPDTSTPRILNRNLVVFRDKTLAEMQTMVDRR